MTEIDKAIRELRTIVFVSFVVQAAQCLIGAAITGAGMYAILQNAPITGGLLIILAFVTCRDFVEVAASRAAMRADLRKLHQHRDHIKHEIRS